MLGVQPRVRTSGIPNYLPGAIGLTPRASTQPPSHSCEGGSSPILKGEIQRSEAVGDLQKVSGSPRGPGPIALAFDHCVEFL